MKCIACLTLLFAWNLALAQPMDCEARLREARSAFRQAAFSEVVATLEPCVEAGVLSEIQELEARRLLYHSYTKMGMEKQAGTILKRSEVRLQSSGALDCRDSLDKARPLLEAYPERVLALLDGCVTDSRMPGSRRLEVLELYTEAALRLGQFDTAAWAFKKIYPLAPQYQPGTGRSQSFRFFAGKFISEPRFSFALSGGSHLTRPYTTRQFSPDGVAIRSERYRYLYDPHIEAQLCFRPLLSNLEFFFGLGYQWNSYSYEGSYENARAPNEERRGATLALQERWRGSQASLGFRYYITAGQRVKAPGNLKVQEEKDAETFLNRVSPYLLAGISGQRLDRAFLLRPAITFEGGGSAGAGENEILLASRSKITGGLSGPTGPALRRDYSYSLMGGVGAKVYSGNLFFSLEVCYHWTPSNIVNGDNRSANPQLTDVFNYLDNDLRLHQAYFSVGFGYSIFYTVKR